MNDPALKTSRREGPSGRVASIGLLAFGAAMLAHAALAFAQVVQAPAWLPVLECMLACLAGLWQLRREESAEGDTGDVTAARPASAASSPQIVSQAPSQAMRRPSIAPARVAAQDAQADRAIAGS